MALRPELEGMGTTVAGVALHETSAILFNVGDSRIYAHASGELRRLSEDHVVNGNCLTKCLGGLSAPAPVGRSSAASR